MQLKKNLFARLMLHCWSLLVFSTSGAQDLFAQSVISALEQEISALVYAAKPAVVTILAMKKNPEGRGLFGFFNERQNIEKEFVVGTGLIISTDGFVITKETVIRDAGLIDVALDNGGSHRVEWVARDSASGIALLKISAPELKPARFSLTEALHAGSWVTVIGNSLGVPHAVSIGVVSAIQSDGVVQISANVDPGSNGSPVFDAHAHAVGMVMGRVGLAASESENGAFFSNTALVHPFADLLPFLRRAITQYYAGHGWIGVTVVSDASSPSRPRILKLIENGPGHKSGLQVGDTITHFNGHVVDSPSALGELVNQAQPGKIFPVKVRRLEQDLTLEVHIAAKSPVALRELSFETSGPGMPPPPVWENSLPPAESQTEPVWLQRRIDALEKEIKALRNYYKRN